MYMNQEKIGNLIKQIRANSHAKISFDINYRDDIFSSPKEAKNIFINALKEALSQGKKSLRSVDKILLSWAKREDLESEGKTPIDDDWTKNLEETIRIAKTPWLDDDED